MDFKKYTILYVDDEVQNQVTFKSTYREYYKILTATGAREALEILHKLPVHLIITDQRMPEITGVEFLEKTVQEFPDTIRMVLTGFSDVDDIIRAINTGRVFRYITKPWDAAEMKMIIDNALNLYYLQQTNNKLVVDLQGKVLEQEKTLKMFQKYVPSEVVANILDDNATISLFEGENKEISILFCDIRNFTGISSHMSPKDVVNILNDFYSIFSDVVIQHNGSVNKYIGDEILALFGAPVSYINNHLNAVYSALEMIEALPKIKLKWEPSINQEFRVGIGINTGEAIVGNMGSEVKLEYSVAGDTVNVAKRIEGLTKDTPNAIFISEKTYEYVKDYIITKELDKVLVKGKDEEIKVYKVLGRK